MSLLVEYMLDMFDNSLLVNPKVEAGFENSGRARESARFCQYMIRAEYAKLGVFELGSTQLKLAS